jgi:hypothetical protein
MEQKKKLEYGKIFLCSYVAQGYSIDLVVFERIDSGNNNAHDDPYLNLINSTESNLKLLIIGGRLRYGDPEISHDLGLQSFPEKIKVEKNVKMIDILEPNVEYDNLKLSRVRCNLSSSLRNLTESTKAFQEYSEIEGRRRTTQTNLS